jgi:hypothetical protein
VAAISLPACHSAGPWARDRFGQPRIAYKPIATSIRGRPFYVSGFGGADYSPSRPRRVGPVDGAPAAMAPVSAVDAPGVSIRQGTWDEP